MISTNTIQKTTVRSGEKITKSGFYVVINHKGDAGKCFIPNIAKTGIHLMENNTAPTSTNCDHELIWELIPLPA